MRGWALFSGREARSLADAAVASEVRLELEHHLACAAEDLAAAGRTPADARAEARRRFGDLEAIERECLRIRTGNRIMLHRLHVATTVLLLISVVTLWLRDRAARIEATVALDRLYAETERHMDTLQRERAALGEPLVVRVGDELVLVDPGHPELEVRETVAADGRILLPEVGWVPVTGLSREELEKTLNAALAPYYLEVDVKVKITRPKEGADEL